MGIFEKRTFNVNKKHAFIAVVVFFAVVTLILYGILMASMNDAAEPMVITEDIRLIQLETPAEDAKTAVVSTTAGDIKIVLYPQETPNAVSIFENAASSGEYNGLTAILYDDKSFFSLNSPELPETYEKELHNNLWPFKGAVCMNEYGDLIFINTAVLTDEEQEYLSADEGELPEVRHAFYEQGGIPNFSRQYAVFGQVTDGMDVLENISQSEAESVITINSVTLR